MDPSTYGEAPAIFLNKTVSGPPPNGPHPGSILGIHYGIHYWNPLLESTIGIQYWNPLLESILESIMGIHYWNPFWNPFWNPLWESIIGIHYSESIIGIHYWNPFWNPFWNPLYSFGAEEA